MRSSSDPSLEDIRTWAYEEDTPEPDQEWDLILSWRPYDDLYLQLAGDSACPKQIYFLRLLYFITGRSVHSGFRDRSEDSMQELIQKGMTCRPHVVHLWAKRSHELLRAPEKFVYDDWCAGKLVDEVE